MKNKKTILFLSLINITNLEQKNIYTDLIKEFLSEENKVILISPAERHLDEKSHMIDINNNFKILRVKIGNIQKTNFLEKGISTILIESQFLKAIKTYLKDIKFDLVLYATPPVTFQRIVQYIKKRDGAKSYLLLKDIFPQNAVDLEKISSKGIIYRYFRHKEVNLYKVSDYIGTMSKANSDYLLFHNEYLDPKIVEINPNSIKVENIKITKNEILEIKSKYNIPKDKLIFLYGGNLGIPQGIDFLLEILKSISILNIHFLIVGSGTEYNKIRNFINKNKLKNVTLISGLPKNEYQKIEQLADVGLIFLDKRFTIPNIPSRMLGYLLNKKPILAATDNSTDLPELINAGEFGLWSLHGEVYAFVDNVKILLDEKARNVMGENGYNYLLDNYQVEETYKKIIKKMDEAAYVHK